MNSDNSPYEEPAGLEVKITALLLGELSADEAAAMRWAISQDPELTKLHRQAKVAVELMREAIASPAGETGSQPVSVRMSERRRQELLAHFKTITPREFQRARRRLLRWLVPLAAAACLIAFVGGALFFPSLSSRRSFLAKNAATAIDGSGRDVLPLAHYRARSTKPAGEVDDGRIERAEAGGIAAPGPTPPRSIPSAAEPSAAAAATESHGVVPKLTITGITTVQGKNKAEFVGGKSSSPATHYESDFALRGDEIALGLARGKESPGNIASIVLPSEAGNVPSRSDWVPISAGSAPVVGDMPVVGSLFKPESSKAAASVIDGAGHINNYVYSGGAVIDDGGNSITLPQGLGAAPGGGVRPNFVNRFGQPDPGKLAGKVGEPAGLRADVEHEKSLFADFDNDAKFGNGSLRFNGGSLTVAGGVLKQSGDGAEWRISNGDNGLNGWQDQRQKDAGAGGTRDDVGGLRYLLESPGSTKIASTIGYDHPGQFVPQAVVTAGVNKGQALSVVPGAVHEAVPANHSDENGTLAAGRWYFSDGTQGTGGALYGAGSGGGGGRGGSGGGDTAFNGQDGRFANTIVSGATDGTKGFFTIQAPGDPAVSGGGYGSGGGYATAGVVFDSIAGAFTLGTNAVTLTEMGGYGQRAAGGDALKSVNYAYASDVGAALSSLSSSGGAANSEGKANATAGQFQFGVGYVRAFGDQDPNTAKVKESIGGIQPNSTQAREYASNLVRDGKAAIETGKFEEADRELNDALRMDPQNQAANYYKNFIAEQRFNNGPEKRDVDSRDRMLEIEKQWATERNRANLPIPNSYARTNSNFVSKERQAISTKLDQIHVDQIDYQGLPLSEVVRKLNDEAKKRDPEKKGLNFLIDVNSGQTTGGNINPATGQETPVEQVDLSAAIVKIDPPIRDLTLRQVLDVVSRMADKPITYSIENNGVVFLVKPKSITVSGGLTRVTGGFQQSTIQQLTKSYLTNRLGVNLSWPKEVWFNDSEGSLLIKGTAQDLDRIQAGLPFLAGVQLLTRTNSNQNSGSDPLLVQNFKVDSEAFLSAIEGNGFDGQPPRPAAPPAAPKPAAPAPIPQPEIQTRDNAFSTFSLNVSDVSFKLAAASLEKGLMPEPVSIRTEEFINAFDYRDPEAAPGAPIAFAWERAHDPFAYNRDLLRFSVKTAAEGRQAGRPLNIVLLLDNSGSMERADRVAIIREALRVLATQLHPQDKLSVVLFARTARLWVDGVSGDQAARVAQEVSGLTPQGGTNLEEAMKLAYEAALRHYLADGMNRVVLLTDGAANLGTVHPEVLKQMVDAHHKQGIALDCFGIGWEGYNDDLLEVLTRNGNGRYGFVNTPAEASSEFAVQLAGALHVAASDVKVQVEFNPARVTSYRQLGYAKHQLTKEQFRDNTVAAAEIAAQEAGNAMYVVEVNPAGEGPVATVRVRYRKPGTSDYYEHEWTVPYTGNAVGLEQASPAMRLAGTASGFSEWLAGSPYAGEVTTDRLLSCLRGVPEVFGADGRPRKLQTMLMQAKGISGR